MAGPPQSTMKLDWEKYNVKVIKGELSKRGLRCGGNKQALIGRLIAVIDQEKFPLFQTLPPEIRDRIWNAALPPRRVIGMTGTEDMRAMRSQFGTITLPSVFCIMLSCKEAQQFVIRRYQPGVPYVWANNKYRRNNFQRMNLSPKDDIFWINVKKDNLADLINDFAQWKASDFQDCVFGKIRTLAFNKVGFEMLLNGSSLAESVLHILASTSSFKQLIVQGGIRDAANFCDEWSLPHRSIQGRNNADGPKHDLCPITLNSYSDIPPTPEAEAIRLKWQEKCEIPKYLQLKRIALLFALF